MADSALYIAIDFGTSYSGYAIRFSATQQDSTFLSCWKHGSSKKEGKTYTCILFDENQTFLQFGYEALKTYTASREQAKKHCFFENFKMELYGKAIHRHLMITAKNGVSQMKAMTVFSESLKYLKDHALEKIAIHTNNMNYTASDVTWVLTIPAIWDPAAKQFMREVAIEAGLVTESEPERLVIALEPEAASVFCKQLPKNGFIAECNRKETLEKDPGTQYMVVDCGGGTIDITVHEVVEEGRLKELHAASGNGMGGEAVDRKFMSFLRDIFSEVFVEFEQEHPGQALKLKHEIEMSKSFDGAMLLGCPQKLQEIASRKQTIESYFEGVEGAEWEDGEILIEEQNIRSFFDDSLKATEDSIKQILLSNPELSIEYIMLVGGYSECKILREFLQTTLTSKLQILCPFDPQTAVIKGAVQYGLEPSVVKSRISALTYGIQTCVRYNDVIHKGKSSFVNSLGEKYCDVCFDQLVMKGDSVLFDEVRAFERFPVETKQNSMRFTFYSTSRQNVKFVDEDLMPIGSLTVNMPKTDRDMDRRVMLNIQFGSTEMKATAIDLDSGQTRSVTLDFMNTS